MGLGVRIFPEPLRSRAASTFTGSYQTLGSALAHPCVIVKGVNNTDQLLTISWDGVEEHDILPLGSFTLYDFSANQVNASGLFVPANTQFWVKGAAGTGSIYLVALYVEAV